MTGNFPRGFVWGAGTSAYQIEGAAQEDGRGPSIWDEFVRIEGAIHNGDTGDVAADHYHRVEEDVALMKSLGLNAYRFSTSWPRVLPDGTGRVNSKGLDFYERLVDLLLDNDIEPYLTLFHWDLPLALHREGGWTSRSTVGAFADYAELMVTRLGDRVKHWSTICEPWTIAFVGYSVGIHAPGTTDPATAYVVAHHLLLAHGAAARRISDASREVMLNLNLYPIHPTTEKEEDVALATAIDGIQNRMFLDAVLKGMYPDDVLDMIDRVAGLGHIHDGDLEAISGVADALGVNYYSIWQVTADAGREESPMFPGAGRVRFIRSHPTTAMGWEVYPDGLYEILIRLKIEYPGLPLYVTENGAAFDDTVVDGRIRDDARRSYIERHLDACLRAVEAGVDLRGYFVWSLIDNFEWAEGYAKRFGITWVDFDDQTRILKDSAHWYRDLIRYQSVALED